MKMKQVLAALCAVAVILSVPIPGFAEQAAKGVVTKVEAGKITIRDKHGNFTIIYIKPGDFIAIKIK